MGQGKFHSNIAEFSETKNRKTYFDSGATHYFFYRHSSFTIYDSMKEENVQGANATSKIVGKVTFTLLIWNRINVEAYLTSVGLLQKNFVIAFSKSILGYPGCFFMKKRYDEHH